MTVHEAAAPPHRRTFMDVRNMAGCPARSRSLETPSAFSQERAAEIYQSSVKQSAFSHSVNKLGCFYVTKINNILNK